VRSKYKRMGLTLVEILTVLAIIALLAGILIPAVTAVKKGVMETKQRAQFGTIEVALTAFKNDYGDYPPSTGWVAGTGPMNYCGSQKFTEALLGWDLLGFHPQSEFTSNGTNSAGVFVYDTTDPVLFGRRKKPYLESGTTNAFKLNSLFPMGVGPLEGDTYVLCDVFGATRVSLGGGGTAMAGAPVLYYKANPAGRDIREVYNHNDNVVLVSLQHTARGHPGEYMDDPGGGGYANFYNSILDPKITARPWIRRLPPGHGPTSRTRTY